MTELSAGRFDLKANAERGAWCQIVDPNTEEPLAAKDANGKLLTDDDGNLVDPSRIKIMGEESGAYQEAVAKSAALAAKDKIPKGQEITKDALLTQAARLRMSRARQLASITLEWEHWEKGGEPFEFTFENAVWLYSEYTWIADQLSVFFRERTNYLGNA